MRSSVNNAEQWGVRTAGAIAMAPPPLVVYTSGSRGEGTDRPLEAWQMAGNCSKVRAKTETGGANGPDHLNIIGG